MPLLRSSHPVPAMNPPTTGTGTNRSRLPERIRPEHQEGDAAQDRHDQGRGDDA